nr:hypothetical protein [Tanacetum cinerariifolium]
MLQSCKVTDAAVQSLESITALHPGFTATGECLNSSTYIDYRSSYPNTTARPNAIGSDNTCPTATTNAPAANTRRPLQTLPSRHPYSDESSRLGFRLIKLITFMDLEEPDVKGTKGKGY